MRLSPLILLALSASLLAGEASYPLWDGQESVADYAKRANLPPTQTLDLGNGFKMEFVLIPAGQFIMGTPEPTPVDEVGFHKRIVTGQALLAVSTVALLVMLLVVFIQAIRKKRRPQLSLRLLLLVTVTAGGAVLSGMHWRKSARELEAARVEYPAATARYNAASPLEKPAHTVTLTQPFYMGKFAVTEEQYQTTIGANLSYARGNDNPVVMVSWYDAQVFCNKLTEQTKQTVRLPTEAEWEFACRAGTTTTYCSGDMVKDLGRVAWYNANSMNTTHPVGKKEPNAFGLYDMHGNVWQWCDDWYDEEYYGKSAAENPKCRAEHAFRSLRGGSWHFDPLCCRSAYRGCHAPGHIDANLGFRVALAPPSKAP